MANFENLESDNNDNTTVIFTTQTYLIVRSRIKERYRNICSHKIDDSKHTAVDHKIHDIVGNDRLYVQRLVQLFINSLAIVRIYNLH